MAVINAQDLKILGVSVIETALANDQTAIISNGASQFVVMTVETYRYMLECELLVACAEGRADIAAGNFSMRTPEEHLEKLKE